MQLLLVQAVELEKELLKFVDATYENIKKEIKEKKSLDDDLKAKIRAMIEEFKKGFQL